MFAKNLKKHRKRKKMSQEDMAEFIGITRQGYAKYENDESQPPFKVLIKMADFFDVTVDELLGRELPNKDVSFESIFPFDNLAISQEEFEKLTAYQQEVLEWAASSEGPLFKNQSGSILDRIEELEIIYEVQKQLKERREKK